MATTYDVGVPEGEVLITRERFIEDIEYQGALHAQAMFIYLDQFGYSAEDEGDGSQSATVEEPQGGARDADEDDGENDGVGEDTMPGMKKTPVPDSIQKTGPLPDGHSVDLVFDPIIVVEQFRSSGIIYESQMPPGMLI